MLNINNQKDEYKDILPLAKEGNIKALESLIRCEQKHVYVIFSHLVREKDDIADLTQEVLLKMSRNLTQLHDDTSFRAWLNKIITNTYYNYMRKKKNIPIEKDETIINTIKDKLNCEPSEKCIFNEIENIIQNAIFTLPYIMRITLILREYEGFSYQDISNITHSSIGTVKSRISRARFKLQKILKNFI